MQSPARERLRSLDQFRGYTVSGMFAVNFLAPFAATPELLRHHNSYCSYADTIMPQFFFAVGFALRLAFLRHAARLGSSRAYWQAVRRGLGLMLLGAVVYHIDGSHRTWESLTAGGWTEFLSTFWRRTAFQALVHIGLTSLWVLPVIARGAAAQAGYMAVSALLHVWISSAGWYDWLIANRVIDGGPLGFLTWTIPLLGGSLTHTFLESHGRPFSLRRLPLWAAGTMMAGYLLACLSNGGVIAAPPFVPPWHARDMWTMSQQAGSVSYLVFGTGFSLLVFVFFLWWSDGRGREVGLFRTMGTNALAAYVIHMMVDDAVKPFAPNNSPVYWIAFTFAIFFGITWLFVRSLEKSGVYVKL